MAAQFRCRGFAPDAESTAGRPHLTVIGLRGTHPCPGGCNQPIPDRYFSCGRHWRELPLRLQQQLVGTAESPVDDPVRARIWQDATAYLQRGDL